MIVNALVLTTSGVWVKPPRLFAIHRIIARSAGSGGSWPAGNGNGYGGGGGAASYTKNPIGEWELPAEVEYEVGVGGLGGNSSNRNGGNGGDTWFGNFIRVSGARGATTTAPGVGGNGMYRGANGGLPGQPGGSASSGPVDYSAGGGGGGTLGGASGSVTGGTSNPPLWQTSQSGGGGPSGQRGGFPAGGGGRGIAPGTPAGAGADGLLTIIEYILEE